MNDPILRSFLDRQLEAGLALAASSDLLELRPLGPTPVQRYLVRLRCKGLVRLGSGAVVEADRFEVGVRLPMDYLRRAHPAEVLTWLHPFNVFHPNILAPLICVGPLAPGTSLVDLIFQVYEVVTYTKVTMREDDALNKDACAWARNHLDRFPTDRRALKHPVLLREPRTEEAGARRPIPSATASPREAGR
jgi:hypothetical protein